MIGLLYSITHMKKKLNRQRDLQARIDSYCEQVAICLDAFQHTFADCSNGVDRESVKKGFDDVHLAEGKADDIRRELENLMYSRAVFPESRGDILGLIESIDRVPNNAESVVRMMLNQHIEIPPEACEQFTELVSLNYKCVSAMLEGVSQIFNNFIDAAITIGKIDKLESEADRIEAGIVDWIFCSDLGDLQKILLRDLVVKLGGIADRAESAGDRMRIMVAKRNI